MYSSIDLSNLEGRSILITGGASGLGLDATKAIAAAGAYVTIADIQSGAKIAEELISSGHHVRYTHCDTSSWESQIAAFKSAIAFSPSKSLDAVAMFAAVDDSPHLIDQVNAAGDVSLDIDPVAPVTRCLEINLKGCYYTAFLALFYFKLNQDKAACTKSLIFISSLAGYIDDTHDSIYTASKFGTRGLFRAIRTRARAETGVRVNLIAPWAVKTPMTVPILAMLDKLGIQEGQGITFAKPETCTEAVLKCAVDETVEGRAFAIMPEGFFDMGDDIEGGYGGDELRKIMERRKAAGDFLQG